MSPQDIRADKKKTREESEEEVVSDNENDVEVRSFARPGRRIKSKSTALKESGEIPEISREEPGEEELRGKETPKTSKENGKKTGKEGRMNKKEGTPKTQKMKWTQENRERLLLLMLSPNMVPNQHKGAIAKAFRGLQDPEPVDLGREADIETENPSGKAVQEQMAKFREASRALIKELGLDKEFGDNEDKDKNVTSSQKLWRAKYRSASGTPATQPMPNSPVTSSATPMPVIDNGDEVFDGFPLTWGDLSEDVRKQVRNACDRRKQKLDRDAQVPGWIEMHKRNYEKQLAREAEKAKKAEEEGERQKAAETMMELSEGGKETGGSSVDKTTAQMPDVESAGEPEKSGPNAENVGEKEAEAERERAKQRKVADLLADLTGSRSVDQNGGGDAHDEEMRDAPAEQ